MSALRRDLARLRPRRMTHSVDAVGRWVRVFGAALVICVLGVCIAAAINSCTPSAQAVTHIGV